MYELKEGRASSFMGGVGGLVAVGFAVLWTGLSISMGAPIWFSLFGVLFGVLGLVWRSSAFGPPLQRTAPTSLT